MYRYNVIMKLKIKNCLWQPKYSPIMKHFNFIRAPDWLTVRLVNKMKIVVKKKEIWQQKTKAPLEWIARPTQFLYTYPSPRAPVALIGNGRKIILILTGTLCHKSLGSYAEQRTSLEAHLQDNRKEYRLIRPPGAPAILGDLTEGRPQTAKTKKRWE